MDEGYALRPQGKDVRLSALVLTQGIYHVELRFACVSTAVFKTTFVDYLFAS